MNYVAVFLTFVEGAAIFLSRQEIPPHSQENIMKTFITIVLTIIMLLSISGCESYRVMSDGKNEPCVGVLEDRNPNVKYKLSTRNLIVGFVFLEMVIPPIVILANETLCPVDYHTVPVVPVQPSTVH